SGAVDAAFSLEPDELSALVTHCHDAHAALGSALLEPVASETDSLRFRRSLYFTKDVAAGEKVTSNAVKSLRPAGGLHTRHLDEVVGRNAKNAIKAGTPVAWNLLVNETEQKG
ncbi:MAG: SAF domain-containing protein, partial [Kordiimonas sp.]